MFFVCFSVGNLQEQTNAKANAQTNEQNCKSINVTTECMYRGLSATDWRPTTMRILFLISLIYCCVDYYCPQITFRAKRCIFYYYCSSMISLREQCYTAQPKNRANERRIDASIIKRNKSHAIWNCAARNALNSTRRERMYWKRMEKTKNAPKRHVVSANTPSPSVCVLVTYKSVCESCA